MTLENLFKVSSKSGDFEQRLTSTAPLRKTAVSSSAYFKSIIAILSLGSWNDFTKLTSTFSFLFLSMKLLNTSEFPELFIVNDSPF